MAGTVNSSQSQTEFLYKILVIGEFGVGKTSIIRRYAEGYFSPNYKMTIGVDFALKTLDWDNQTRINIQLWDIAGHERFGLMTRVYYKYAIAAIVVFDLTREPTFNAVTKWLQDVRDKVMLQNDEPVPVMLLANKCDLLTQQINTEHLNKFCKEHKFVTWFPTSAKDDINIDEAIQYLVGHVLENTTAGSKHPPKPLLVPHNSLILGEDEEKQSTDKCC